MGELTLAEKLFNKLSKKERNKIKLEKRKAEIEDLAKNNELLAEYIDVISKITAQNRSVSEDKEPLRLAMKLENRTTMEDKYIKVTTTKDYNKTVIDTKLFYENFKPTSKTYQKVVVEQSVKGSIKVEDK